jgi:hypothetical protein
MSDRTSRLPEFCKDALLPLVTRREALSALAVLFAGCTELDFRLPNAEERARKKAREKAHEALRGEEGHSKLIGDYLGVRGLNTTVLEGVGLVTNLNGTGDDPPASVYRTQLLEDMKRRNIKNPNTLIADPSTALVLVRAYLPPLIREHEKFDVEVSLPDGSECTSLSGGSLMECELTEQAYVRGKGLLRGHRMAVANGAVLTVGKDSKNDSSRRGSIPAGATYAGLDQNLSLHLRPDYTSFRMCQRIAARIGLRFHDYDESGQKRPLAEAKTDSKINLILHRRYRDNYPRFLQVIGNIQLTDTPVDRRLRMERLRDELLAGPTSERAALELEAIGVDALPVLREGLDSELLEVRFHAAQALAYQGHSDSVPTLIEAAGKEPAFRVFAFAALAALGTIDASTETVQLLSHDSMETRYGAVRALTTINDDNPAVRGEKAERGWILRVVRSTGEPMVHVTQRGKEEVVVFGANQEFQPPMVVTAGAHFVIKAEAGKPLVTISRFVKGRPVVRTTAPATVADVIRELGRLQASYPDIVQMLVEAERQHNLEGPIGIDVLPRPGRIYTRPSGDNGAVGSANQSPNLFGIDFEPAEAAPEDDVLATPDSTSAPDDGLRADNSPAGADAPPTAAEDQVGFTVQ